MSVFLETFIPLCLYGGLGNVGPRRVRSPMTGLFFLCFRRGPPDIFDQKDQRSDGVEKGKRDRSSTNLGVSAQPPDSKKEPAPP